MIMFLSDILLKPPFQRHHTWRLEINNAILQLQGATDSASAIVQRPIEGLNDSSNQIVAADYSGIDPIDLYRDYLFRDGMTVDFEIASGESLNKIKRWRPSMGAGCRLEALLRFCWTSLYGRDKSYDRYLELLFISFNWGIPAFRTGSVLRIVGLAWPKHVSELKILLSELCEFNDAVIDLSGLHSMGASFIPLFKDFAIGNPSVKWIANERAAYYMRVAKISFTPATQTG